MAVLAENRIEYVEIVLAAAKLGAIVCALNWRLARPEQEHCIRLTEPSLLVHSARYGDTAAGLDHGVAWVLGLGAEYEALIDSGDPSEPEIRAEPEDGLLILYTSGTTGLPKGALISHRAEIARLQLSCIELGLRPDDTFVAWPPLFHMASMDQILSVLCLGGTNFIVDGFDVERLVRLMGERVLWWIILMPGTIEAFRAEMQRQGVRPKGVRLVGAMPDLVPLHQIAEITAALDAEFINSFGSTETGIPPATAGKLAVGEVPDSLDKVQCRLCEVRLVDPRGSGRAGRTARRARHPRADTVQRVLGTLRR